VGTIFKIESNFVYIKYNGEKMFDWVKFVLLARMLEDRNDEESIRTAINRLYYGFFGVVRRYLLNLPVLNEDWDSWIFFA
jgi:hypothetical protein